MSKLKPCPFCGSKSIEIVVYANASRFGGESQKGIQFQAFCHNCYATTSPVSTENEAAKDWNRRAKK